jgi:phage gp29-like protein
MDGIQAEIQKVPTWMFEVKEGRMRFLPTQTAQTGVELENLGGRSAWMTARGRGVMLAGVVARMFKQIPLQDWLTYCDRHGMPAFLGKTGAANGSPEWQQMYQAVGSIGSEFGAVVNTGDVIDVLNLTGQGEVPYVKLIDRMDRAQVMLWRGGDLSTMSRENGTGSNPQQEDADELDADNAAWVSETINRNLTAKAIAWKFGRNAPVLCELRQRTKTRQNVAQDLATVSAAKQMGIRVDKSWFLGKFGIVEAAADEAAIGEMTTPQATALNAAADMRQFLNEVSGTADADLQVIRKALAKDMQPLARALEAAYQAGDAGAMIAALRKISTDIPNLTGDATATATALATKLANAWAGETES